MWALRGGAAIPRGSAEIAIGGNRLLQPIARFGG